MNVSKSDVKDFRNFKERVDEKVIVAQEIERVQYNNTYRIFINSRVGTDRPNGGAHNDFRFTLPTIPGVENCDCVCRIRGIYLPTQLQTGVSGEVNPGAHNANQMKGNLVRVYTNFLKPKQFQVRQNTTSTSPALTGDCLGTCSIKQKVFDVTLNQGVITESTFIKQRIDGKLETGSATEENAPYYALYSDGRFYNGALAGSNEPQVNGTQPSAPTDTDRGEIHTVQANRRFMKMTTTGQVDVDPQGHDAPANNVFITKADGQVVNIPHNQGLADTVAFEGVMSSYNPMIHNIIPAFNNCFYQKLVKGYEGRPLSDDWIPCRNPFGNQIHIVLRRPNNTAVVANVSNEEVVNCGTSDTTQVEIELEVRFLPDYRSI